ncbi:hypothetical protein Cri9333_1464 [Crinalium epipsammum PCC 9333]|uniref:Uncharacterized protein n=1 Tax=Crinalium epipsammum PCC 9333 TaxID=1173022 RepID=K9VXW8_9CYAN|nr:hypothetical protein [Crinalium epipsammum]AFZ12357.1 hypothetical protein Cri9333_1464 [Crinalium epipsammum PCC 9333]
MQNQADSIIRTSEPIIAVPSDIPLNIPPQYWDTETGLILAIAILIRSIALMLKVLTPLILKQKPSFKK